MTRDDYITLNEAATEARVTRSTVSRWCNRGGLTHTRTRTGRVLIHRRDLDVFQGIGTTICGDGWAAIERVTRRPVPE